MKYLNPLLWLRTMQSLVMSAQDHVDEVVFQLAKKIAGIKNVALRSLAFVVFGFFPVAVMILFIAIFEGVITCLNAAATMIGTSVAVVRGYDSTKQEG